MAGLLTEKIRESQKRKSALDLWKGLLDETGIPELFSGRIGGQTLEQGIQNRMQANSLRPALSPQQMVDAGLNIVGMAPLGMFIGKGAKTWDVVKASEAMQMEKAGKPPREIWAQTGNWKGPDGQWRQEIPDNAAHFGSKYGNVDSLVISADSDPLKKIPVSYAIKHNEMQTAYPDVMDIGLSFSGNGGHYQRMQYPEPEMIRLGDRDKSTLLHELQHAIQQREGWARGGSPESMQKFMQDVEQRKAQYFNSPEFIQWSKQQDALIDSLDEPALTIALKHHAERMPKGNQFPNIDITDTPNSLYQRLAGEAEARATQARMNMDMPQRLATFPEDSYDVPMDQLIVRYGDGPAMAINPSEYGLPVNPDGTVSLLHGTTKDAANKIIGENRLRSAGEPSVYLTNAKDAGYGDGTLVQVDVDPRKLFLDDEFPGGRFDFSMPVRNGVANVKNARMYGDGPSMSTSRPLGVYPWAVPLSAGLLGSMFLLPNDAEAQ